MRKNKEKLSFLQILVLILFIIAIAGLLFLGTIYLMFRNIERNITIELGNGLPNAEVFVTDERNAEYKDAPEISLNREGDYELILKTGFLSRKVTLHVRDTTAPVVSAEDKTITIHDTLLPNDLITEIKDASPTTIEWGNAPQFGTVGDYPVSMLVKDTLGHETIATTTVTIIDACAEWTIEAGEPIPDIDVFLKTPDHSAYSTELEKIDSTKPGDYTINISFRETTYPALLRVRDTTPPSAEVLSCETHCGYPLLVDDFIGTVYDVTRVTANFKTEPDWTGEGEIAVIVLLTDEAGNTTELETTCNIIREHTAPELMGVVDRYCYVDEAVSYLKNIYVTDNYDAAEDITITVDKSSVNTHATGDYKVTYTATDRSGNSTTKSCTFHFIESKVSADEIDALVDQILSEILTDDMTVTEQAYAIFVYIYDHIYYTDQTNITDWQLAAYKGLTTGRGDCFTYFSCSYIMLNKIDCQVIPIKRARNYLHHFWCLVNVGTGWYHFDPTNFNTDKVPPHWAFMRTTSELYSRTSGTYFWNFDPSLYPEIETKAFVAPD